MPLELLGGPKSGREAALAGRRIEVLALAVDRHRGGDDHLSDCIPALEDLLEQDGAPDRIDGHVPLDLVHGLTDTDRGGEVHDRIDAVEGTTHRLAMADVSDQELDCRVR